MVAGLAVLAVPCSSAAAAGLQSTKINHVSLQVSDLNRSREFYRKVLGLTVVSQGGPENTVSLGQGSDAFLILRHGNPVTTVDHFAISLNSFDKLSVTQALKQQLVTPLETAGAGFHVKGPDGFNVQLTP